MQIVSLLRAVISLSFLCLSAAADDQPRFEVQDSELTHIEHFSLQAPFVDEYLMNRYWDFGGSEHKLFQKILSSLIDHSEPDTHVNINQFVRITPNRQSQKGWLWARMPVVTQKSWVVEFEFKVHGGDRLFGDGFAFWYTKGRRQLGDVFGSADMFEGLGLFFDTYTNGRNRAVFPYITAMIGDGNTKYDESTDGRTNEVGSCTAYFRERDYVTRAKVVYVENKMLQVFVDVDGLGAWRPCFTKNDVSLPERGYFGFTSHTGDASDNHDIIRVTSYAIDNEHTSKPEPPSSNNDSPGKSYNRPDGYHKGGNNYEHHLRPTPTPAIQQSTSGASYIWYSLLVIFIVFAVAGIAFAAFVAYKKMNSPKSYKRF
ncbi:legume-like lectin family-domain-containing protein [Obelidium mucronatum]|nr:legume-like lectin family-domain-containing protein [Obelidium mucronatum]